MQTYEKDVVSRLPDPESCILYLIPGIPHLQGLS